VHSPPDYQNFTAGYIRRRWYLLPIWIALLLVILLLIGGLFVTIWRHQQDAQVDDAMAVLDREDPGWRWQDIEAARRRVPDEENGALHVSTACDLLPSPWNTKALDEELISSEPNIRLTDHQADLLNSELEKLKPALIEARKLEHYPTGRYVVQWGPSILGTPIPHVRNVQAVCRLLRHDALLASHQSDPERAIADCIAGINVARSIGDEPFAFSQAIRSDYINRTLNEVESTLAQGVLRNSELLERLQHQLQIESEEPLLRCVMRGERAVLHNSCSLTESDQKLSFVQREASKSLHALYLTRMTDCVRATDLPLEQSVKKIHDLAVAPQDASDRFAQTVAQYVRSMYDMSGAFLEHTTRLRCMIVLVAAERYRMDKGVFPHDVAALVPTYLPKPDMDPFGNGPMQIRPFANGIEIYSIAAEDDLKDSGLDGLEAVLHHRVKDVRYRLWEITQRGRPAQGSK
jgi:hypothetical protein